jgi:heterodisulfide reductase subunit B
LPHGGTPRQILEAAGCELVEMKDADKCCGLSMHPFHNHRRRTPHTVANISLT